MAVFTGADVARDGLGTMKMTLKRTRPDGSPMFAPAHRGLAVDRARHVGDPVAHGHRRDPGSGGGRAPTLVRVDYEPLPAVTDTAWRPRPAVPRSWDECPDNVSNLLQAGDRAATERGVRAGRPRVVRRRYVITRVHAQYMEPRGALGVCDPGEERYTLHADVQYPHRVRDALATNIFKIPEHQIRVIAGDVGGAFGTKGWQYPEHRLVLWAARKLGRPVKWTCERREAIPADEHARDNVSEAELALDAEGRFLGLRVHTSPTSAPTSRRTAICSPPSATSRRWSASTRSRPRTSRCTSVLTNTNPTAPYRGAGRPEATYVIERLIDDAARELGHRSARAAPAEPDPAVGDAVQTPRSASPTTAASSKRCMDGAARWPTSPASRPGARRREARGKLRGLGIVNAIERAAGAAARVRRDPLRAERHAPPC